MPLFDQVTGQGLFLPTTQLIDKEDVSNAESTEDLKQVLIRIVQAFNDYALAINLKNTGMYDVSPFVTGQVYFPDPTTDSTTANQPVPRQVSRLVVDFGALPNNANSTVAHGLTFIDTTTFTAIYATATDSTNIVAIPIPMQFAGSADKVDIRIDANNVNIQTNFDATSFDTCYVVLEYLQQ